MTNKPISDALEAIIGMAKQNLYADIAIKSYHNPVLIEREPMPNYSEGNRRVVISIVINDTNESEQFAHEFPPYILEQSEPEQPTPAAEVIIELSKRVSALEEKVNRKSVVTGEDVLVAVNRAARRGSDAIPNITSTYDAGL